MAGLLEEVCHSHGEYHAVPEIWLMIETPLGVLRAEQLASMQPVKCLVAGTSDLAADLRCDGTWQQRTALLHSLSHVVLAARAHEVAGELSHKDKRRLGERLPRSTPLHHAAAVDTST